MSDIPVNPGVPGEPTPVHDEGLAERYVDKELVESRASLRRTQIIGALLSVFTVGYMAYLTSGFHENLEPKGAAQVATGLASQRLDDFEPQVSEYVHNEVPKMIRNAPDELIRRMPDYRQDLEDRVVSDLQSRSQQGAAQLSKDLDEFLTAHKDQVQELLDKGQDPAAMEEVGNAMEAQFTTFLHDQKIGDTTIAEKLDSTLETLKRVAERTTKLQKNVGLTPAEKSARHAIGMLMHRIKGAQAAEPNAIRPIDVERVQEAANGAAEAVRSHLDGAMAGGTTETAPTPPQTTTGASTPVAPKKP